MRTVLAFCAGAFAALAAFLVWAFWVECHCYYGGPR